MKKKVKLSTLKCVKRTNPLSSLSKIHTVNGHSYSLCCDRVFHNAGWYIDRCFCVISCSQSHKKAPRWEAAYQSFPILWISGNGPVWQRSTHIETPSCLHWEHRPGHLEIPLWQARSYWNHQQDYGRKLLQSRPATPYCPVKAPTISTQTERCQSQACPPVEGHCQDYLHSSLV